MCFEWMSGLRDLEVVERQCKSSVFSQVEGTRGAAQDEEQVRSWQWETMVFLK
jgi:hypothetical protein